MPSIRALASHHTTRRTGPGIRTILGLLVSALLAVVPTGVSPPPAATGGLAHRAAAPFAEGVLPNMPSDARRGRVRLENAAPRVAKPAATTRTDKTRLVPATGGFR